MFVRLQSKRSTLPARLGNPESFGEDISSRGFTKAFPKNYGPIALHNTDFLVIVIFSIYMQFFGFWAKLNIWYFFNF